MGPVDVANPRRDNCDAWHAKTGRCTRVVTAASLSTCSQSPDPPQLIDPESSFIWLLG